MLSFAQNAEDVLLWRVFSDVDPADGFYVDIGANHPIIDSVTKHFYDEGWHGVNVEPVASLHELYLEQRRRDVNLNAAVGSEEGTLTFHHVLDNDGLSTLDPGLADHYRRSGMNVVSIDVPIITLEQVFAEHVDQPVQFLKIDVEGHEHEVIQGANWERDRPKVVMIEATTPEKWEDALTNASYRKVIDDGINYVFVADEHSELADGLSRPVTVVDNFTSHEWIRRTLHYQRVLETYGFDNIVKELLSDSGRHPSRERREAAEALTKMFVAREDLIRTFVADGHIQREGLLRWALDTDPAVDPALLDLMPYHPGLSALRSSLPRAK
jgi:FkbM family methyltransferase